MEICFRKLLSMNDDMVKLMPHIFLFFVNLLNVGNLMKSRVPDTMYTFFLRNNLHFMAPIIVFNFLNSKRDHYYQQRCRYLKIIFYTLSLEFIKLVCVWFGGDN